MGYIDTPAFDRWAKRVQREMLTGVFDQVRPDIIDWNQTVTLPISSGAARWTKFTVVLSAFRVMAQYELPFADEDPQFVGAGISNGEAVGFAAPNSDLNVNMTDTYPIGLEVFKIDYLNLLPCSAELVVRAYDQSEPIAKVIMSEFADSAESSLKGATATIPYGNRISNIGLSVIDKIENLANSPKQIGSHYFMFLVKKRIFWRRPPNMTSWFKYKFVAFVEDDPEDAETPFREIYMTLWELNLLSDEAITGLGRDTEPRNELKSDSRTEEEKRAEEQEREEDEAGESDTPPSEGE